MGVNSLQLPLCKLILLDHYQKYLDISETLRRYTTSSVLLRVAGADYKVPGTKVVIKKGERLIIPVQAIQLDSEVYPDAMEFNIDRNFQSLFSFGQGPRKCIAERFAMIEMKVALCNFLRSYRISKTAATPATLEFNKNFLVLAPVNNLALKVEKISG